VSLRGIVASLVVSGVLVVSGAMVTGSTTSVAAQTDPTIVAIELADGNSTMYMATTAGLLGAELSDLQDAATFAQTDAVWASAQVAGRDDRPIDDLESLTWPRGETLTVASEGVLWAQGEEGNWSELSCAGEQCPSSVDGISSTFDDDRPKEHDLIVFGEEGLWVRARDRSIPASEAGPPTGEGWTWIELDSGIDVVAVAQDQRHRIWALVRVDDDRAELRVYDDVWSQPERSEGSVVTRPLPTGWTAADGDSLMTPDTRGGMWLALPQGVLWMNVDLAVHDEIDQCDLGLVKTDADGSCPSSDDQFSVMSVDNAIDDVWVGSSGGLIRLSIGEAGALGVSAPRAGEPVVSLARNVAGGDVWVASANELDRIEVDRWSYETTLPDAVTALSSGRRGDDEVVLVGTTRGLRVARWDPDDAELRADPELVLRGLIAGISRILDDGSAYVVTEVGVTRLDADGQTTQLPDLADRRVAVVEVIGDRVYAGTATGVRSAPAAQATENDSFEQVELPAGADDVTAIWESDDRVWVGTGGAGLLPIGDPVTTCGVAPPPDAVVRSATATGDRSFVVVTSDGVYDARPSDECDVSFERRSTADTNMAVPAGDYDETVAKQVEDRSRLVWAGADHGVDLIAWTGAFPGIETPVVSDFDRLSFLDSSRVSALATVGDGLERTLIVGTDYGVFYHRPALIPPGFALDSISPYGATGDLTGDPVECDAPETDCAEPPEFDQETRRLDVVLKVDDLGDGNRFQFVVDDGDGPPTIAASELEIQTGRGQTESLTITALDLHLNASEAQDLELVVRRRTIPEWFVETNAKWIAALMAVALVGILAGFWVVRAIRRLGRHRLVDVEVVARRGAGGTVTVTTASGTDADTSTRLVDVDALTDEWDRVRETVDAQLVPPLGDRLYDSLFSRHAGRVLERAGLGSRDLRLRLRGFDPELAALPWEALCTPSGSLVSRARTSVVRDLRPLAAATDSCDPHDPDGSHDSHGPDGPDDGTDSRLPAVDEVVFPVRVLVVVASPGDLVPVAGASDEIAAIEEAARTKYRGRGRGLVEVLEHASPESLRTCIGAEGYDFVHVIAHGERTGRGSRIWLEDVDGDAVRMESDELCDLFAGQEKDKRRVRLVVLNTCSSAENGSAAIANRSDQHRRSVRAPGAAAAGLAADLVRRANVPAVVGMSMRVRTPAAVAFGTAFYETLFRHGQVDHAMLVARREVRESDADWLAPRLFVGAPDPELFGGL
jgi:hypothetical protein